MNPAATLQPSHVVADGYLAPRSFSSGPQGLHQFFGPSLPCMLSSLPRSNRRRSSATAFRSSMLPSPFDGWLGFEMSVHGACSTFDTYGLQSCSPTQGPGLSGGTTPCFRSDASPQLHGFWLFPW